MGGCVQRWPTPGPLTCTSTENLAVSENHMHCSVMLLSMGVSVDSLHCKMVRNIHFSIIENVCIIIVVWSFELLSQKSAMKNSCLINYNMMCFKRSHDMFT